MSSRSARGIAATGMAVVCLCLGLLPGCFQPYSPTGDREERLMEALAIEEARPPLPSPLTPADAVEYAMQHNLDARVAELDLRYQNESLAAAHRRMLPSLTLRYTANNANHPAARWSQDAIDGSETLKTSFSAERISRQAEAGAMWNVLDFGVGYFKAAQQHERILSAEEQVRRVRQQVTLDVLSAYWRAAAAVHIADEAEAIRSDLEDQAALIRDSVDMRILSPTEGARRELVTHNGLTDLEQWRRTATQNVLELAKVLGCGRPRDIVFAPFPTEVEAAPGVGDPAGLQAEALRRRPELYQQDAQERIAYNEAKLALLQMAPNASLSLSLYDDPDKFLLWNNWMTVGARVSWNLLNIPARMAERRMAKVQRESARQKGLALAAGVMAQVGIAYSDWALSFDSARTLTSRSLARKRLVDALAEGEQDGQTRPGEVLQERVKLLEDRALAVRAMADTRIAEARLAAAVGLDFDADGRYPWQLGRDGVEGRIARVPARDVPLPAVPVPSAGRKDRPARGKRMPAETSGTPAGRASSGR